MKLSLPSGATGFYNERNQWQCTGSQMGRRNIMPEDRNEHVKLRLERLSFVDGCYDKWGAYWGAPANIYCAWGDSLEIAVRVFVRSNSRNEAKAKVRQQLPQATFYR